MRFRRLVLVAAVLLVLAALAGGATAAPDWWGRTREIQSAQQRLSQQLDARWASDAAAPATGPQARLHLPTLSADLVVLDATARDDRRPGPGYIPGTAPIGTAGNTGIAGERVPGVFWNLDRLDIGDPVILETRDTWFVYRVMEARVVRPEDGTALDPPPPGASPVLTLMTDEPRLSTARRLIRQATLIRRDPHEGPRPAELT
ncbi:sortase domain-containing protein [Dactylosporangium sp. CS-047395]|uniref:sortase domain-containing protein n=1 Tax=Dactylosporangium sp. CS-047395 TaxID=3239936 RepID=UPI003D9227F2